MRTEKSPLRIACKACSRSSDGLDFPLPNNRVLLARRVADGAAGPISLMDFPLEARARIRAFDADKNCCRVPDQAGKDCRKTAPRRSSGPATSKSGEGFGSIVTDLPGCRPPPCNGGPAKGQRPPAGERSGPRPERALPRGNGREPHAHCRSGRRLSGEAEMRPKSLRAG